MDYRLPVDRLQENGRIDLGFLRHNVGTDYDATITTYLFHAVKYQGIQYE
jgi:hypothetical protein